VSVPIARFSYTSRTADEAWDTLSQMYTRAQPHTSSPEAALTVESAAVPAIAVDRVWLHAAEGAFSESPDQVNVISVLSGRISLHFGRAGAAENLPGDSYLYLPDRPADLEWDTFSALAVRLPLDAVDRAAEELTGLDPGALRFLALRPLSALKARLWLETAKMLWRQFSPPDSAAMPALVHRELVNVTAAAALSVFPNTAMTRGYIPGPGDMRPVAIRRAVAYIDAHASLPITVTDIAAAAGVGPRALRDGFRRHLDITPTAYLRRVRLDGAHRDLQDADPSTGITVDQVAARWGFPNMGRFAISYHQTYDRLPEQTLHS
jgi:AraC-like DNA-binding protein